MGRINKDRKHDNIPVGARFGRLEVIGPVIERPRKVSGVYFFFPVKCDCGTTKEVAASTLLNGGCTSCGCRKKERMSKLNLTHGCTRSGMPRIYQTWVNMRRRCHSESEDSYPDYGGRGISVCDEWRNSFEAFLEWATKSGYTDELTIERIDVNRNYEPSNCKWIPMKLQARNRRNTRTVTAFGETKPLFDWAEDPRCNIPYLTMADRFRHGWDDERILTEPIDERKRNNKK